MRTLKDMLKEIIEILNDARINYVVMGGMAVSSWGEVRSTADIDIIMSLDDEALDRLITKLEKSNFSVSREDIEAAIKERSHVSIFDKLSIYHIDAKGAYGEKEKESLESKRKIKIDGIVCWITSPEDTIANKLLFGREQDIKDAEGIYVRQLKKLDVRVLEERCRGLGVWREFLEMEKRVEKYLT